MQYIDLNIPVNELTEFLEEKGWIQQEQVIDISRPGEGNMNVVLRVSTNRRSFILKQSRPFVQKYQDIPAPLDRIDTEFQFYNAVKLENRVPGIFHYSPEDHLLMMEDLGHTRDFTIIYNKKIINVTEIEELIQIVKGIHYSSVTANFPENMALRKLNHQHIFQLPFLIDNGFNLNTVQDGLQALSARIKNNEPLIWIVDAIGKRYLSPGEYLIHGDYYPGSWMRVDNRIFILDPEFSFVGFREFDVGVMAGHLVLSTMSKDVVNVIIKKYGGDIDEQLVKQMAGIEMMRRIIGLAQLPLDRTLSEKEYLLELATDLVLK